VTNIHAANFSATKKKRCKSAPPNSNEGHSRLNKAKVGTRSRPRAISVQPMIDYTTGQYSDMFLKVDKLIRTMNDSEPPTRNSATSSRPEISGRRGQGSRKGNTRFMTLLQSRI
jgi:hypothetical protein